MEGMMHKLISVFVSLLYITQPLTVSAVKKKERYMNCGACIALVDEIGWKIATTDRKKKLQVGSFRIDPTGSQNTHEIPYARSELHLIEIMERVCNGMRNYITIKDPRLNKRFWIRKTARDGAPISMKHTVESDELQKLLKFRCETLLEEHEEEIIRIFGITKEDREAEKIICVETAGICRQQDLDQWLMVQGQAVMDGMTEEAEEEEGDGELPDDVPEEYDMDAEQAADEAMARAQDENDADEYEDPVTEIPPMAMDDIETKDEL